MNNNVLVTYEPDDAEVRLFPEILGEVATINYLARTSEKKRYKFLKRADVIVALSFSESELDFREISYFQNLRLFSWPMPAPTTFLFTLFLKTSFWPAMSARLPSPLPNMCWHWYWRWLKISFPITEGFAQANLTEPALIRNSGAASALSLDSEETGSQLPGP